jgi:nucleoside-diphosphate-sugar epimerase
MGFTVSWLVPGITVAGHASPDEYQTHPIETLQTSALGSFAMAELARKNGATLLFASTSEIYGDAEVIPTGCKDSENLQYLWSPLAGGRLVRQGNVTVYFAGVD